MPESRSGLPEGPGVGHGLAHWMKHRAITYWGRLGDQFAHSVWDFAKTDKNSAARLACLLMNREPGAAMPSRWLEDWVPRFGEIAGQALLESPEEVSGVINRLTVRGARPVLVIGDSHSRLYLHRSRRRPHFLMPFGVVRSGASARGLGNPNSKFGVGLEVAALLRRLRAVGSKTPLLLVFGQVDVEFVHVFKLIAAKVKSDDPAAFEAFCDTTIDRYINWLDQILEPSERGRTFLAPIFPSALSDAAWAQGYVNAHLSATYSTLDLDATTQALIGMEIASTQERTARHRAFNAKLRAKATLIGLSMLDDYEELYDDGQVAAEILEPSKGSDHHLDHIAVRNPVLRRLWQVAGQPET